MSKKTKITIATLCAALVVSAGAFLVYKNMMKNNIEIENVVNSSMSEMMDTDTSSSVVEENIENSEIPPVES